MKARITSKRTSKKGNVVAFVVASPSPEDFLRGAKPELFRVMAEDGMEVGGTIDIANYTVGQSDPLPQREGKPNSFSRVTWLDKA
jgi:hypothetical protein